MHFDKHFLRWQESFKPFNNKGKGLNDNFDTIEFIDAFIRHNLKDSTFVTTYYPGQSNSEFSPYKITTPKNSGNRESLMINTKHYTNKTVAATFTPYLRFNNKVYRFKNFIYHTNQIEYEEVSDLSEGGSTVPHIMTYALQMTLSAGFQANLGNFVVTF